MGSRVPSPAHGLGAGTGENVENHVQENVRWISFKTHKFFIFHRYTIAFSEHEFESFVKCMVSFKLYHYIIIII